MNSFLHRTTGLSPTGLSRLQGLLIGLAVAAVTTGVVAAVAFTSKSFGEPFHVRSQINRYNSRTMGVYND